MVLPQSQIFKDYYLPKEIYGFTTGLKFMDYYPLIESLNILIFLKLVWIPLTIPSYFIVIIFKNLSYKNYNNIYKE